MNNQIEILVQQPGLHTSIQDLGRPGYQNQGVPLGGSLDHSAHILANRLVGNPDHYPLIEITLLGPKLLIKGSGQIALAGGVFEVYKNGALLPFYETIPIEGETELVFKKLLSGCRAYLAVGGVWEIPTWLGSKSLAPFQSEQLTPASLLYKEQAILIESTPFLRKRKLPLHQYPDYARPCNIEVLAGPEFAQMESATIAHFFSNTYHLSPSSNRMGARLLPLLKNYQTTKNLISTGVIPGTLQITNEGQVIVLQADAQTIGGYPRLGVLSRESLDKIAQLKPGDPFRFIFSQDHS